VLAARYERQLPLYRQRQIYAAAGISVDRTTLADWVEASWLLLEPLVEALARHVLGGSHLHAANLAYPILAHGTGRTRRGRLWLYVRDERAWGSTVPPAAWLRFTPDRSGAHARAHLAGYSGTLQGPALDEEPVYHRARMELLGCWAELRERIAGVRDAAASGLVEELLQPIDALYQIERANFGRPAEARRALRLEHSRPLLDALHARLRECLRELPKKAELTGAIRFALAHWKRLERYSADGRAQMDGLDAQQLLHAVAGERISRGTDTHGARAAGLYGLIATARLNGRDPEQYLRWVLEQLSAQAPRNWEALLPWALSHGAVEVAPTS
jgi:transposase